MSFYIYIYRYKRNKFNKNGMIEWINDNSITFKKLKLLNRCDLVYSSSPKGRID